MMGDAAHVAEGLQYPGPGRLDLLASSVASIRERDVRHHMERFVGAVRHLTVAEWEELHTRTLDLSPYFVPYVGHVVWGENYRRGAFMADLARELAAAGIDCRGELPDHLEPILRYLDVAGRPLSDLAEVFPQAIARMRAELVKADKTNPYRHVLDAAAAAVGRLADEARRVSR